MGHGSVYYIHFQRAFHIVTFSSNFNSAVCLITVFVCMLREFCTLRELLQVALSCIDHDLERLLFQCGVMSENLKVITY